MVCTVCTYQPKSMPAVDRSKKTNLYLLLNGMYPNTTSLEKKNEPSSLPTHTSTETLSGAEQHRNSILTALLDTLCILSLTQPFLCCA